MISFMVQKMLIQPLALLLAVLTFTSSVGLAVDMHFCKGTLKNISFFGKAATCTEMITGKKAEECSTNTPSVQPTSPLVTKKKCCSNHTVFNKVDVTAHQLYTSTSFIQHYIPAVITYGCATITFQTAQNQYFHYEKPPPAHKDFAALYQNFRI